ncbi:MAG TPA: hypothetical protein VHE12_09480 [bacterium]|nr:hypothetical protein [bacterium]
MKILAKKEGEKWLQDHQLPQTEDGLLNLYKNKISYTLPKDSGIKTALARSLKSFFEDSLSGKDGIFWITDWEVWPSSENQNLFYAYRKTLKDDRTILDAPFHIFDNRDIDAIECLLDLALYFIWGVVLIFPGGKVVIRPSHNECIDVYTESAAELMKFKELFEHMKFPVLS